MNVCIIELFHYYSKIFELGYFMKKSLGSWFWSLKSKERDTGSHEGSQAVSSWQGHTHILSGFNHRGSNLMIQLNSGGFPKFPSLNTRVGLSPTLPPPFPLISLTETSGNGTLAGASGCKVTPLALEINHLVLLPTALKQGPRQERRKKTG